MPACLKAKHVCKNIDVLTHQTFLSAFPRLLHFSPCLARGGGSVFKHEERSWRRKSSDTRRAHVRETHAQTGIPGMERTRKTERADVSSRRGPPPLTFFFHCLQATLVNRRSISRAHSMRDLSESSSFLVCRCSWTPVGTTTLCWDGEGPQPPGTMRDHTAHTAGCSHTDAGAPESLSAKTGERVPPLPPRCAWAPRTIQATTRTKARERSQVKKHVRPAVR